MSLPQLISASSPTSSSQMLFPKQKYADVTHERDRVNCSVEAIGHTTAFGLKRKRSWESGKVIIYFHL